MRLFFKPLFSTNYYEISVLENWNVSETIGSFLFSMGSQIRLISSSTLLLRVIIKSDFL